MGRLYDVLNKMTGWMTSPPIYKELATATISVAANGRNGVTKTVTKSGWTPVGIVGVRCSGVNAGYARQIAWELQNVQSGSADAYVYFENAYNANVSWTVNIHVLWMKNI